jgi:hypothetical protein
MNRRIKRESTAEFDIMLFVESGDKKNVPGN